MAKDPKNANDERSAEDTKRIADKTLKTLLSTPPKPRTGKGVAKGSKR